MKSIKLNRNFSNSLAYVNYLAQQNENLEALKQLKIMELELVFSEDERAVFLGSLANGFYHQKSFKEAGEVYNEALAFYRALAQNNPSAFGIDLARTIIVGVYSVGMPKEQLDEAEKVLHAFNGIYIAEQLLNVIKRLREEERD